MDGNEPAFSIPETQSYHPSLGLTKRELFAAMAMQSLVQAWPAISDGSPDEIAKTAIAQADALIAAL